MALNLFTFTMNSMLGSKRSIWNACLNTGMEETFRDHTISQDTQFRYLRTMIQSDGVIEGYVNHRIKAG